MAPIISVSRGVRCSIHPHKCHKISVDAFAGYSKPCFCRPPPVHFPRPKGKGRARKGAVDEPAVMNVAECGRNSRHLLANGQLKQSGIIRARRGTTRSWCKPDPLHISNPIQKDRFKIKSYVQLTGEMGITCVVFRSTQSAGGPVQTSGCGAPGVRDAQGALPLAFRACAHAHDNLSLAKRAQGHVRSEQRFRRRSAHGMQTR